MSYKTIIGLEIHAQLLTVSKAFCSCENNSAEKEPNKNICPVCTGHPGTLPVLNKYMVLLAAKTALALRCQINHVSSFDRKNYFYPDMPKGYQITQYFVPIAENGQIEIFSKKRKKIVKIKRLHMEEDSGKLIHERDKTLVDFNRSGIPLVEIVTEPDINSSEEAVMFLEEIRNILRYLKVCDGHLENGSMRCDVNISVCDTITGQSTNRVELKNLNSFKNVQKALSYEEAYHKRLLENGRSEPQCTKSWDEKNKETRIMRKKETESDYRYLPEPDLPSIEITEEELAILKKEIPELPSEKIKRFIDCYHMRYEEARILAASEELASFFEDTSKIADSADSVKWILRDLKRYLNEKKVKINETYITPERLGGLINQIKKGRVSNNTAKEVLVKLLDTESALNDIIQEDDFLQQNDMEILSAFIEQIISENYEQYEAYRLGKKELFNFFVGRMMGITKGRTKPELILKIVKKRLE